MKTHSTKDYLEWLLNLTSNYGMSREDLSTLTLAGFNIHVLSDIHDTVMFNMKQANKEGNIITAQRLDSLYKHAREVDIFPTLSIPAKMDFILVINHKDFYENSTVTGKDGEVREYIIDKTNYITVGSFIYSFDDDIVIRMKNTEDPNDTSMYTASYLRDETSKDELPEVLRDRVNDTIKVVKRKTVRGWEYHLYLTLKQYAREVHEREFGDRDYAAFNYTVSAELIGVKAFWNKRNERNLVPGMKPLHVKFYFENSRTSEDSIYLNFDSPTSFNMIHKSQENGFRPRNNDTLVTMVYTTSGYSGNFTYAKTIGDDIKFVPNDDTTLPIQVVLQTGESRGGISYTNNKEDLRKDIITKRSTRSVIVTENDLLMQINNNAKNNEHFVIKNRNDIIKLFNVFTTLKYWVDQSTFYYIPTNTLDVKWNLLETATLDVIEDKGEVYHNATSFLVKCSRISEETVQAELIDATEKDFIKPLLEEFRLGISKPTYNQTNDAIIINDNIEPIPLIHPDLKNLVKGQEYIYKNRLYTSLVTKQDLGPNEAIRSVEADKTFGVEGAWFESDDSLYYWLPFYVTYIRSKTKNFVKLYEQTNDMRYDLDYELVDKEHPYSFICNWVDFEKTSLLSEYAIKINVRNNLTEYPLIKNGFLAQLPNGNVLDVNALQAYLLLYKKGELVYSNKFSLNSYVNIPESSDDYIDYKMTILPAGYMPKILDDKIAIYSDITNSWVMVPITDLKAVVKIYDVTGVEEYQTTMVTAVDPNDPKKNINIPMYKNVDFTQEDKIKDKYLINEYTVNVDILQDATRLYKAQHILQSPHEVVLLKMPLVQYTFYKHFSYLYYKAIEEEYSLLDYVNTFQGEFSLALKYTNTYGYSRYYTIGKSNTKTQLNNIQLDMEILVRGYTDDLPLDEMSRSISDYINDIDFTKYEKFHISKLYDYLFDKYRGVIDYMEFQNMNGKLEDNQLVEMTIDKLSNDTIIEKLSIPYTYDGNFKYNINWKVLPPEVKK